MYINLALGAVALFVVWLWLRKLLVKEDGLKERPSVILEREIAKRRRTEELGAQAAERLREGEKQRLRPVADALKDLCSALPAQTGEAMSWEDAGDAITIRMRGRARETDGERSASLVVRWRIPDLDLRSAARCGDGASGDFTLRRSDTGEEERVANLDACIRSITAFIVDFMD
jgi:hypothetical protein